MGNWCSLPDGVIVLIARFLEVLDDFVAFRGTCTTWRAATVKDFDKWSHGLPLLMLNKMQVVEKIHKRKRIPMKYMRDEGYREFFSLYKKKIIRISLPEAKGKHCIASIGWFITIGSSRDMSLLNPITRVQIHLPFVCEDESDYWAQRAVLSASPSEASEYVVAVIYVARSTSYIRFWKTGGLAWKKTQEPNSLRFQDVSYHNGKIYAISYPCQIWMFDVWETGVTIIATKIMELPDYLRTNDSAFFVECGGKLLILTCPYRYRRSDGSRHLGEFTLIELDVNNSTHTCISSLGEKAIFLGINEVFCVDATRFPGIIEPNHIYLSDGSYRFGGGFLSKRRWDASHDFKIK